MSYQYNPYPNIQGLTGSPYAFFGMGETPNPFFTLSGQFTPRNFNDVIKWTQFLTTNSPLITEVIYKLASYPITDFIVDTEEEAVKKKNKEVFEALDLKTALINVGFHYKTLGNVFLSLYFPIKRMLHCQTPNCGSAYSVEDFPGKLTFTQYQFRGTCPACNSTGVFRRRDIKSTNLDDVDIIMHDPTDIAINHNPITGKSEYWYKIPGHIRQKITGGDMFFLSTIPWGIVEAVKDNKDYRFYKNGIFHLKGITAHNALPGYGVPPLLGLYNNVFDQAMLRRANSAIAAEMISPLRIIYPETNGRSDPTTAMSLNGFARNMRRYVALHKTDPNLVAFSPVPVGYQAISGEGKTLLVTQELEAMEDTLLLSLGVSRELLTGTTNWTSSTVGLRLLENSLWKYIDQIQKVIDWVMKGVTAEFNLPYNKVTLEPFKLTDNDQLQALMVNLSQGGILSQQTTLNALGFDFNEEQEKIKREAVVKAKEQVLTQFEVELTQWMAAKNTPQNSDDAREFKDALQKAQETANELIGMPEGPRRSALMQLKVQNPAMYLMTSKLIEEYRSDPNYQQQVQQQGQQAASQAQQGSPTAQPQQDPSQGQGNQQ